MFCMLGGKINQTVWSSWVCFTRHHDLLPDHFSGFTMTSLGGEDWTFWSRGRVLRFPKTTETMNMMIMSRLIRELLSSFFRGPELTEWSERVNSGQEWLERVWKARSRLSSIRAEFSRWSSSETASDFWVLKSEWHSNWNKWSALSTLSPECSFILLFDSVSHPLLPPIRGEREREKEMMIFPFLSVFRIHRTSSWSFLINFPWKTV